MRIRSLASASLIYGLGNVARRLSGLLLIPIYTSVLSPHDYGVLALLTAAGQILFNLANLGVATSVYKFYIQADGAAARGRVLSSALLLTIVGGVLPVAVIAASPALSAGLVESGASWVLLALVAVGVFGDSLTKVPSALLRAENRALPYSLVTTARWTALIGLSVWFVVGLRAGVFGVVLSQALVDAVLAAGMIVWLLRAVPFRPDWGEAKAQLRYGAPLIFSGLSQFVLNLSDRYILKLYVPLSEIGLYSLGYRFGEVLSLLSAAFVMAWMPFYFQALREDRGRVQVARAGRMWLYLVLAAGLATCVFGPDLLRLLTPDAFTSAERYIPLVTLGMVFVAFLPVASVGLYMAGATRWLAIANIGAAALNIGMNFALIPRIGAIGAAWSTFVAFAAQTIVILVLAQKAYPLPFEWRRWAAACAAAVALGAGAFAVPDGLGATGLAARAVIVLLFPAGILLFGGVSRGERAQIVSLATAGFLGRAKTAPPEKE